MENLGFLVDHLRNAVAHRDLKFAKEDGPSEDIEITAINGPWTVSITASNLWDFLEWLLTRIRVAKYRLDAKQAHRRKPVRSN